MNLSGQPETIGPVQSPSLVAYQWLILRVEQNPWDSREGGGGLNRLCRKIFNYPSERNFYKDVNYNYITTESGIF
jgi:hypothetical protein